MSFSYDRATHRFRDSRTGRFISRDKVQRLVDGFIRYRKDEVQSATSQLLDGKLTVAEWERAIAQQLKTAHITAYAIGRGGTKGLTPRDNGIIGARLRFEYKHLREFSKAIAAAQLTEKQIRNRVRMYQDSLHSTYSRARDEDHRVTGAKWEKWLAVDDDGTCGDCGHRASLGWSPFGTLGTPGDGTECGPRCRCAKLYSHNFTRPQESAPLTGLARGLVTGYGWLNR